MAVYVDELTDYGGTGFFSGKKSCHMWADTLEELHRMADAIGMRRAWFQDDPRLPHYDLVVGRRNKALKLGAIPVTRLELIKEINRRRHVHSG